MFWLKVEREALADGILMATVSCLAVSVGTSQKHSSASGVYDRLGSSLYRQRCGNWWLYGGKFWCFADSYASMTERRAKIISNREAASGRPSDIPFWRVWQKSSQNGGKLIADKSIEVKEATDAEASFDSPATVGLARDLVGRKVTMEWLLTDSSTASFSGWIVEFQESCRRHVIVYDADDLNFRRRVYAHNLLSGKLFCSFSEGSDGRARRRGASKAKWTSEEEENLVVLAKSLEDEIKQCERAHRDRLWLWAALACKLGRLASSTGKRSLADVVFVSVQKQYRVLTNPAYTQAGTEQTELSKVLGTGVDFDMVVEAMKTLPERKGDVAEVYAAVEKLYGDRGWLCKDIAGQEKTRTRWQLGVRQWLHNGVNSGRFIRSGDKRKYVYSMPENDDAAPEPPPKKRKTHNDKKLMDYGRAFGQAAGR